MAFEFEASEIRKAASSPSVRFLYRRHAEQELQKDDVSKIEVENMLRRCRVTKVEQSGNDVTRRAEGTDATGRPLVTEVVLYREEIVIKVITGWIRK